MIRRFTSDDEPAPCRECNGEGELSRTPCCNARFTKPDDDGYHYCAKCRQRYDTRNCPSCHGKGIETP
jgi:hypothetical protein